MAKSNAANRRSAELDELTQRRNRRNLEKARRVLRERRRDEKRADRRRARQRLREITSELNVVEREYEAAYRKANRLGQRKGWDEKEAAAWDDVAAMHDRINSLRLEQIRLERQLGLRQAA